MNVYFDTEFTGLVPNTKLVSIGLVSEMGDYFYAEFNDYGEVEDEWIRENVLGNLWFLKEPKVYSHRNGNYKVQIYKGDTEFIREKLEKWFIEIPYNYDGDEVYERIQLVSDVCHYDMYLLCNQIFGGAQHLPANVNAACYDICQDIAVYLGYYDDTSQYDIHRLHSHGLQAAFNRSREELLKELGGELPGGKKHNSLYDAVVIERLYDALTGGKV